MFQGIEVPKSLEKWRNWLYFAQFCNAVSSCRYSKGQRAWSGSSSRQMPIRWQSSIFVCQISRICM